MTSLRQRFREIGLGPNGGSTLHQFFGLGRPPEPLSLKLHLARTGGRFLLHLNVIRLAFDTVQPPSLVDAYERRIDLCVHRTRQIYDQVGICLARVHHFLIPESAAGSFPDIGSDGEADDLASAVSVDNDAIDLFMVQTYAGDRIGSSRRPGSCDKEGKASGVVIEVAVDDAELLATAFAHELGHYLGLGHHSDDANLMFPSRNDRELNDAQGMIMLRHCMVFDRLMNPPIDP